MSKSFQVGEAVTWSSQASGRTKRKSGVVAQVVPAGERPSRERFERLYKGPGCGFGRNHESYVVLVGSVAYWPLVRHLRASEDSADA